MDRKSNAASAKARTERAAEQREFLQFQDAVLMRLDAASRGAPAARPPDSAVDRGVSALPPNPRVSPSGGIMRLRPKSR